LPYTNAQIPFRYLRAELAIFGTIRFTIKFHKYVIPYFNYLRMIISIKTLPETAALFHQYADRYEFEQGPQGP
jgi:hypothetical protein